MSEMAKNARAAMKAKATRMGGKGDPKTKVDASSWSPPEMMNTGAKVGMRPLSRRAFRKGGKVIEKCEGGPAAMRADRKQRKAGGRATSLVTDMINRNVKKANKYREGGDAHVGGYKSGGDVEQDKKLVKKAFRQHDEHMHGGKHEDIKLKKGGRTKKQGGGGMDKKAIPGDAPTRGYTPNGSSTDNYEDMPPPPPTKYGSIGELIEKEGLAKKNGGGTYFGGTRPTGGRMPKAGGGSSNPRYSREAVAKEIRKDKRIGGKEAANIHRLLRGRRDDVDVMGGGRGESRMPREALYDGPTDDYPERKAGGRAARKSGGRAKGKTNISITINPQQPQDQQAMMPKMPTPPPMPPPPIAPPGMGPGMPPMPMPPPGGMPPGLGGPPPGMPPMPRKRGGRAYRSYKDMDAGALGGMGRLEKVEIEHGKRVGRLSGGRARSYKDMIALQKHKR